ncbi:LysR substrate-binding domain-containing protein [Aquabacter spiritensis]|uniref:DNA-binding transcriptional LysR family regulator n=1 Tax=Aquabacter spiritensis TaxID=933073 RepID=A0A4R3M1L3_9HYPH|nr:LysR substrate-binding domain-containing protein [Aquabacter spiritensis]TCT06069.1 DNA-binding transcriptional LysR family regulator [Aquabacter spiritensis]
MRHLRFLRYMDEVARTGSIRRAAGRLNVTPSALNRRIMDLEEELGLKLLERRARGVDLTAAGEVFVSYIREQLNDAERMRSQLEDLRGLRRGTVRIACSQALAHDFLPQEAAAFRKRYPLMNFEVMVADHEHAVALLIAYEVDLILVFRPPFVAGMRPLMTLPQRVVALMPADHPLAAKAKVRLADCTGYPLALPERSTGGRQMIEEQISRSGLRFSVAAQSNSFELLRGLVAHCGMISFQIQIGALPEAMPAGIVVRPIDERDLSSADLVLGQLRGRNLPLAGAQFAEHLTTVLRARTEHAAGAAG